MKWRTEMASSQHCWLSTAKTTQCQWYINEIWNNYDGGKPKYSVKTLSQCHFILSQCHFILPQCHFILPSAILSCPVPFYPVPVPLYPVPVPFYPVPAPFNPVPVPFYPVPVPFYPVPVPFYPVPVPFYPVPVPFYPTTNPNWTVLGLNMGHSSKWPAPNCMKDDTAQTTLRQQQKQAYKCFVWHK